jgi:NADPH:quinone reductase-like Zn-dependent oxidoreductase
MKAILYTKYGPPDVLELHEVQKPVPKENQVLVKIHASSVNAFEWRRFTLPSVVVRLIGGGLREPKEKSIGGDLAGRVESIGSAVTRFRPGDEVFGLAKGAYAEYACTAEDKLVSKPTNVSFEAAASVPIAALTALQALRAQGNVQAGQQVLIHGAGGGVGTFAVQIAKAFGAEVTAVCGTQSVDAVWSLGADDVLDYTREDFLQTGRQYDLIIAVNGYRSIFDYRRALKPEGVYVLIGGAGRQLLQGLTLGPILSGVSKKKTKGMMTRPNQEDLVALRDLLASGKLVPIIDSCYPLEKVSDAVRFLMKGHARGKVVIAVQDRARF